MTDAASVLVVTGLAAEARLLAGDGVICISASPGGLAARLEGVAASNTISAVVSFGLAGGLAPGLATGSLVVGTRVVSRRDAVACTHSGITRVEARLTAAAFPFVSGAVTGRDTPVLATDHKNALHVASGALIVDTESHMAAVFAMRRALPFAVLRAVSDPSDRALPPLALGAIGPDGRLDWRRIGREIVTRPGQVPLLPGTALGTFRAMRTLRRVSLLLGPGLGFLHLG